MHTRGRVIPILALLLLTACGGGASPASPPDSTDMAGSPAAESPSASAAPTSASLPPASPLPVAEWIQPKAGSVHERYKVRLAVDAPGLASGVRATFQVTWRGGVAQACVTDGAGGPWSCQADLLALGVPPGKLRFAVNLTTAAGAVVAAPPEDVRITYAVAPPKPGDPRWKEIGTKRGAHRWEVVHTFRARWTSPAGYADEFLVYGSWECPRYSEANSGTPCFVPGMPVDVSQLELLATVPGDARSVKVRLTEDVEGCNPGSFEAGYYNAILIRARNAHGNSPFAIAYSEPVWWIAPGDMVC